MVNRAFCKHGKILFGATNVHQTWDIFNILNRRNPDTVQVNVHDCGLYRISVLVINRRIGDIQNRTLYNRWLFTLAVSGCSKQNYKEILLAINRWRNSRRRTRHRINVLDLIRHGVETKTGIAAGF